jgi:hypothetical protein
MKQWKAIALALVMCAGLSGAAWAQPQAWGHQDWQSNYRRDAGRERDRRDHDRRRGDRDDRDRNGYYGWGHVRGDGDGDRDDGNRGRYGTHDYGNYGWYEYGH